MQSCAHQGQLPATNCTLNSEAMKDYNDINALFGWKVFPIFWKLLTVSRVLMWGFKFHHYLNCILIWCFPQHLDQGLVLLELLRLCRSSMIVSNLEIFSLVFGLDLVAMVVVVG